MSAFKTMLGTKQSPFDIQTDPAKTEPIRRAGNVLSARFAGFQHNKDPMIVYEVLIAARLSELIEKGVLTEKDAESVEFFRPRQHLRRRRHRVVRHGRGLADVAAEDSV